MTLSGQYIAGGEFVLKRLLNMNKISREDLNNIALNYFGKLILPDELGSLGL